MGNGEALLNRPRRWADTCAGFVPSRSAGRRAAVSACLLLGLCLPSVSGRRLASRYGLFNDHGALLSPCEQSHVPWPCCAGLDTLLSLALVELVALCPRWRAPIQVDSTLNPAAEVSPFGSPAWRSEMAILCCCGKLRARKRPQHEEDAGLPVPPPPARLPAPVLHASAISPGSTLARSSLTNPLPGAATDASVHLGELVVEESDEDDNVDEDPAPDSRNRSTSTLQAVKSRIRRHLSQDSLQRQSETEEQIAHRAEVKRLMRKRIQEELQSEVDNVPSRPSTPQRRGPGAATISGNGPRDTIEFTVDESHKSKELTPISAVCVETDKMERCPTSRSSSRRPSTTCRSFENENRRPTSLVASEPDWIDANSRASRVECHVGIRERSSLPDMPNSPVLLPARGSVFHDASSLASWRLSLSPEKLADLFTPDKRLTLFRPIANTPATRSTADLKDDVSLTRPRSKSSPLGVRDSNARLRPHSRQPSLDSTLNSRIPTSKSLIRDESPVGLWLRTQSMPFHASSTSQPQSEIGSESHDHMYTMSPHCELENPPSGTPTKPSRLRDAGPNQHFSLLGSPSDFRNSVDTTGQSTETAIPSIHGDQDSAPDMEGESRPLYAICSARRSGPRLVSPGPDLQRRSVTQPAAHDTRTQPDGTMPPHPHRRGITGLRLPSFRCECPLSALSKAYTEFHQQGLVCRGGVKMPMAQLTQCLLLWEAQPLFSQTWIPDGRPSRLALRPRVSYAERLCFKMSRSDFETLISGRGPSTPWKANFGRSLTTILIRVRTPECLCLQSFI